MAIMLMSTNLTHASDAFCFPMKGVRVHGSKNDFLLDDSLGYRLSFDAAKYQHASEVVISIPSKIHDIMQGAAHVSAQDAQRYNTPYGMPGGQSYGMAIASLGASLALIIADEASRVTKTVSKREFEESYCDVVLAGKAIGQLGPGGGLTYATTPGQYVIQAWADYYKFQGYVDWSKRAKTNPISLQAAPGKSYTFTFTPHLLIAPPSIDASYTEDR